MPGPRAIRARIGGRGSLKHAPFRGHGSAVPLPGRHHTTPGTGHSGGVALAGGLVEKHSRRHGSVEGFDRSRDGDADAGVRGGFDFSGEASAFTADPERGGAGETRFFGGAVAGKGRGTMKQAAGAQFGEQRIEGQPSQDGQAQS